MKAYAPNGQPIVGTVEIVPACAAVHDHSFSRNADGRLAFEFSGGSELDWGGQQPKRDANGERLFAAEDGSEWPESALRLEP
jgi:hypothetical protein